MRELVPRQVDKKSGGCQRREGSGVLEEEIGVWDLEEEKANVSSPSLSPFLSLSHILSLFFFFFKPRTDDYTTNNLSQETPGVIGKFGLRVRNEAGQRLIEFSQENDLVIVNTLFQ